jgi:cytidylate kinase
MAIITISRGCFNQSKSIANELAQKIGYKFVAEDWVLGDSIRQNIPEAELIQEVQSRLSILDYIEAGEGKHFKKIQASLIKCLLRDDTVYYTVMGQAFLQGVPHALCVRIVDDPEDRARNLQASLNISMESAQQLTKEEDAERRRWCYELYGIDIWESKYYDMVLKSDDFSADSLVDLIIDFIQSGSFETTRDFQKRINRLAIEAGIDA